MMMCMCMCMMMCMMSMMGGGPFGALFGGLGSAVGGLGSAVGGAGDLVGGAGTGVGKGLSAAGDVLSGEAFKPKLTQLTGTDREKTLCYLGLAGRAEGTPIHHSLLTGCKSICPGYPDDVANCDFSTQFLVKN